MINWKRLFFNTPLENKVPERETMFNPLTKAELCVIKELLPDNVSGDSEPVKQTNVRP